MATTPTSINLVRRQTNCVWWHFRTGLEKYLICGWTSVSLLFFALSITVITLAVLRHTVEKATVCLSKECINSASRILRYLDESIPPCHDFYQFACGKWLKSSLIGDQSNTISSFSITQEQINWKLRNLLEEPINSMETQTVKNLKNMYKSCINLSVINELGAKPLMKYLELLGGWPLIDGDVWNETKFDLINLMTRLRTFGFKYEFLFNIKVAPKLTQNTINNIYILEPVFSCLSKKALIDRNSYQMQYYLDFMVEVAVLLGADEDRAVQELKEVLYLESLIARAYKGSDYYQFKTVRELNAIAPNKWTQLINGLLSIDFEINENETLVIYGTKKLMILNQIINDYGIKNKRVLANYLIWKVVFQSIKRLGKKFTELIDDFYSQTRPLKWNTKQWKTCLSLISANMKTGLTFLYIINDKQREQKKNLANQMFETIRWTLHQKFDRIYWMDNNTRLNAKYKIKAINKFIGYTDELINYNKIDEVYRQLPELNKDNLFDNLLKLQKWNSDTEYSKLRTKNNRNHWLNIVTSTQINAYYSRYMNGIKIPIWILNGIFFGVDRPNYLNYGSLGWVIGHELIHPFDNIGGRYDSKGNQRDWWDIETKQHFNNKSQCFVAQYGDHNIKEKEQMPTLSEDMADNGGIRTAFRSYQKFVEQNGQELPLPALNYTAEQLFWISGAQIWCTKLSRMAYKYFLDTSIHSLSEHRVRKSFSNSNEFSKVFKCNKTDPMNPQHKCKVW